MQYVFYTLSREKQWKFDIVKIPFVPICGCDNNRRIWRHHASTSHSYYVTDQLWWRRNAKSEKTVRGDNGEKSDRWDFLAAELFVEDIK